VEAFRSRQSKRQGSNAFDRCVGLRGNFSPALYFIFGDGTESNTTFSKKHLAETSAKFIASKGQVMTHRKASIGATRHTTT
jgi:hypothetical protein